MCGRFNLLAEGEAVQAQFGLSAAPDISPRYNIAPTQPIAAVRVHPHKRARELTYFQWGLLPSWAKDPKISYRMFNARSETAHEKPSFRAAYKRRRCLVPSNGFYEWQKTPNGKQPMLLTVGDSELFAMAGLWEYWSHADGSEIESCTVLTCEPNALLAPIHNRMPVILGPEEYDLWLDSDAPLPAVKAVLRPFSAESMQATPISTLVNNARNDVPDVLTPVVG